MWQVVHPVIDHKVRGLCRCPYPGHERTKFNSGGCPNFGKVDRCPPRAPVYEETCDLTKPVYAIWTTFDLAAHVEKMRDKHKKWTWRQLVNCLYWQPTARANLRRETERFLQEHPGYQVETTPEAMGVNVFETMASIGETLERRPETVTYQVALGALPLVPVQASPQLQMFRYR
jgi:hypothetical protein